MGPGAIRRLCATLVACGACCAWSAVVVVEAGCGSPTATDADDLHPGPDAAVAPTDDDPGAGEYQRSIVAGGLTRTFDVLVPPGYDAEVATPLVVDLHAQSMTKEAQATLSGFRRVAREQGFIAAWPQGYRNSWNAYDCCGEAAAQQVNDVGFVVAMVDAIATTWNVDRQRVYVTGYDNGGALAHRLACERAHVFAAAAPIAYAHDVRQEDCAPFRPLSIVQFCGTGDDVACDDGRADASFEAWVELNACAGAAVVEDDCRMIAGCLDNVITSLCTPEATHFDIYQTTDIAGAAWRVFSATTMPLLAGTAYVGG